MRTASENVGRPPRRNHGSVPERVEAKCCENGIKGRENEKRDEKNVEKQALGRTQRSSHESESREQ